MINEEMHLKDGTLLQGGRYRIVRFLSSGGFGCTYEAVHTQFRSRVALKEFFISDFCNRDEGTGTVSLATKSKRELVEKLKGKFLDEARSVFRMQHEHIVRVMDVFEENGTAYYAMDFIEGQSLADMVRQRSSLPEGEAVGYIRQVADALAYVHSLNRLHLDVKPGNIMVNKGGKAILIDFGTSKQYDEVSGENTSTLMGRTPGFAPPEQMDNSVGKFIPATDIYALGATLYKLLTGITPPST
ncbi:MAG: serine/threonine protein kinase, partial [Prevotellaceae bacterium]|nr:serine/threonine protein kinase [Prevotellaceae bacterium]